MVSSDRFLHSTCARSLSPSRFLSRPILFSFIFPFAFSHFLSIAFPLLPLSQHHTRRRRRRHEFISTYIVFAVFTTLFHCVQVERHFLYISCISYLLILLLVHVSLMHSHPDKPETRLKSIWYIKIYMNNNNGERLCTDTYRQKRRGSKFEICLNENGCCYFIDVHDLILCEGIIYFEPRVAELNKIRTKKK